MRAWVALLATVVTTPGCHEGHQTGGAGAASGTPPATSAKPAPSPAPTSSVPDIRGNPMAAYAPDVVARYDAKAACSAACVAGLRCRVDALFKDGSREVPFKMTRCKKGCAGEHAKQAGYLEKAKKCLASADCAAFSACASGVLPAKL